MKRALAFLVVLSTLCCFIAPQATWASDSIPGSEEVYGATPSGDMSRIFLGQIFGTMDHAGLTGNGSLMPAVFKAFNTAALGIGAIIVMFSLIVSTLNTAHQGEVLGQQWSTMWVPFRIITGLGILVPSGAGYTLLQSFIMWSVLQGIGAANYVWQQAVDAVNPSDESSMVERGWIMAGAYYYDLTETIANDDVLGDIDGGITFNFQGLNSGDESGDKEADKAIQMGLSEITRSLNIAVASWMHLFTMQAGDPLLSIQKTGEQILGTVEILWIGIAIISAAVGVASVCSAVLPIFSILHNFITWLVPLFTSLLVFLFLSSALLAYYIPLIPFILFSLGAIGWLFGVIEAIAASPLIALGIMNPHGNDPYFGRSEPALLFLLDIVVRPAMMIIGMMAAMVTIRVAVPFINMGFGITGHHIFAGGISFLTSIIAMIVVYCAIIVTVVQKCFGLIHYVPDRVMRWVGGAPNAFESGGGDERDIRGGFDKGMQPMGELGGQAAGGAGEAAAGMAKSVKDAWDQNEAGGLSTSAGPQDGGDSTPLGKGAQSKDSNADGNAEGAANTSSESLSETKTPGAAVSGSGTSSTPSGGTTGAGGGAKPPLGS